jgi:beta-1,4-mannosyl-glycoprotein beta-1,4-N-acetylglucosaminyltransferase
LLASIIIPTYNHFEDCLRPCLESVVKYTDLSQVEVIVVGNGCTDGTASYMAELTKRQNVRYLSFPDPLGYPKATNAGLKVAQGKYIVFLNNDTELKEQPTNQWLQLLIDPMEADQSIGITGPMVTQSPETGENFTIFFCACTRAVSIKQHGLLDEGYSPGWGEDVDFCMHILRGGQKVVQVPLGANSYYPEPKYMVGEFPIWHKGTQTFREVPNGDALLRRNRSRLREKWAKKVKLNLGCGDQKIDGYIGVDLYNPNADLKLDICDLSQFQDNSVDEILAVHVLEHLNPYNINQILAEWYRVLKPLGKLVLELPDIEGLCRAFMESDKGQRYHLINCIYGTGTLGQPSFTPHLFGWYYEILHDHLAPLGFGNISKQEPQFDHWGVNFRLEAHKMPQGFFSELNGIVYRQMVERMPDNGTLVELGTWKGRSLAYVADLVKSKNLRVLAVDTFGGTPGDPFHESVKWENIRQIFDTNIRLMGLENHVDTLQGMTVEMAKSVPDGSVDLVFVDADHSYEAVRDDIAAWRPKLTPKGEMCGHDYVEHCGVPRAVQEAFGTNHSHQWDVWFAHEAAIAMPEPAIQAYPKTSIRVINRERKVFDCFPFFNEIELLEIRLNELKDEVDFFVLVEATVTHSGLPKPAYYAKHKHLLPRELTDKIVHVVAPLPDSADPWVRERAQRDAILDALAGRANDKDIVIISDADEIPSAKAVRSYNPELGMCQLDMKLYYYYLNLQGGVHWGHGKIMLYEMLKSITPTDARYYQCPWLADGGWHFSYQGGVAKIIQKIESWGHQEYNTPENKDPARIERAILDGVDLFGRNDRYDLVDLGALPQYVQRHASDLVNKGLILWKN